MMRIIRKFVNNGIKYTYEENVDVKDVLDIEKIVIFRTEVWEWAMYQKGTPPVEYELFYTLLPESRHGEVVVEGIVGRLFPKDKECTCGSKAVGSSMHSAWCNTNTDEWDDR